MSKIRQNDNRIYFRNLHITTKQKTGALIIYYSVFLRQQPVLPTLKIATTMSIA